VTLATPSQQAAGSLTFNLNTTGDPAHNQSTETWELTIYGQVTVGATTTNVITNPVSIGVYRWLAREHTSIDVKDFFRQIGGNQAVVLKGNSLPVALAQSVTTPEDTPVPITLLGSDPEGDPVTFSLVAQPKHGTLSGVAPNLVYTPAPNFNGKDSFTFKVDDGKVASRAAKVNITVSTNAVSITVTPVNDAPFFNPIANQTVNANAGPQTVLITGVAPGPATATDEAGQTVTMTATSNNTGLIPNPTISGAGATRTLTYAPVANQSGTAIITVVANDGQAANKTFSRMFTITVVPVVVSTTLINPNFETGNLSGWTTKIPFGGFVHIVPSGAGFTAKVGAYFALLKTNGPGSFTTLSQSFAAAPGDTISGWAFFNAGDYMPYNDNAQVQIKSGNTVLATVFSASVATVGNFGKTPWTPWQHTVTAAGTYTVVARIANAGDSSFDSHMGLDGLVLTQVQPVQLSISPTPTGGTIISSPPGINCGSDASTCSATFTSGTSVTLTATAYSGFTPGSWGGACSGPASSPCVLTMSAIKAVTATFSAAAIGAIQFSISPQNIEGSESGGAFGIGVTRSGGSQGAVSVTVATTAGGTATAGADYTALNTTLSWASGETGLKQAGLFILPDAIVEPNETVNLVLSTPTGGAPLGSPSTMVFTIIDDDA
jgi:hypothetical protein